MKRIVLLGASGSIGTQTLELIERYPQHFSLYGVSGHRRVSKMKAIVERYAPEHVIMPENVCAAFGPDCVPLKRLPAFIEATPEDVVIVNALVGTAGLEPSVVALEQGRTVLLANKESLVSGGALIAKTLEEKGGTLIPIDSEHSALRVLLKGRDIADVERLVITASGGALRDTPLDELASATQEAVLAHPSWKMGAKVTVDSATMMNKVFEIIEAHWLFSMPYERLDAVLHKESVVHAFAHFRDGNVTAHVGPADMRIPILTALQGEKTLEHPVAFRVEDIASLRFEPLDEARYPLYRTGLRSAKKGGFAPVVLNAANEAVVSLFLRGDIAYGAMPGIIEQCLSTYEFSPPMTLDNILDVDRRVKADVMKTYAKGDDHDSS